MIVEGGAHAMTATEIRTRWPNYSGRAVHNHLRTLEQRGLVTVRQRVRYEREIEPDPVTLDDAWVFPRAFTDLANHLRAMVESTAWACTNPTCFYRVQPAPLLPPLGPCPQCFWPLLIQYYGVSEPR